MPKGNASAFVVRKTRDSRRCDGRTIGAALATSVPLSRAWCVAACVPGNACLALTHAATSVTVARMATLAAAGLRIGIPGCAPARVRRRTNERTNEQTNEREPTVLPLLKPLRKKRIEGIGFITTDLGADAICVTTRGVKLWIYWGPTLIPVPPGPLLKFREIEVCRFITIRSPIMVFKP